MTSIKGVEEVSRDFTADLALLRDDVAKLSSSLSDFIRTQTATSASTVVDAVDNQVFFKPPAAVEYLHWHEAAGGDCYQRASVLGEHGPLPLPGLALKMDGGDDRDLLAKGIALILAEHGGDKAVRDCAVLIEERDPS